MSSTKADNVTDASNAATAPTPIVLEQWTLDVLDRVARKLGFSAYRLAYAAGSNVGDNFMGIMLRVRVTETAASADTERAAVSLMLKMPPQSAARRKQFNSAALFERETLMYRDILPMFVQFQKDKGMTEAGEDGFFSFPKCLAIVCEAERERYAIVMEDLREQGYRMFNKADPIDLAHVRHVMQVLARLHAVSLALRDQRPELFEPLTELRDVFLEQMVKTNLEMMQQFMNMAFERGAATLRDDEVELKAKVEKMKVGFVALMDRCVNAEELRPWAVINHGDCWNNNFMYLYKGTATAPHRIGLIDFQIARFASPILDLAYFLFSSTTKELRDGHLDEVLRIYHSTLSDTVAKLDSDPERLFGYAEFRRQWTALGKYGALIAPMLLQVITAAAEDIPDMDRMAEERERELEEGKVSQPKLFVSERSEAAYQKRMGDVFRDADAYGLLDDLEV